MTTKRKKRHPREKIFRKILEADRVLAENDGVANVLRQPYVTEPRTARGPTSSVA